MQAVDADQSVCSARYISKEQITEALKKDKYKVLTFTHGEPVERTL